MRNVLPKLRVLRAGQRICAPKNAVAWDRLGVALQSRGVWTSETEQAYRRAVQLDPQFAVAYAHLARVLNKMGRRADAEPLYAQAGQLAKDAPTLNLIAESLQAEQQWENSEPVLKRALELEAAQCDRAATDGPNAFSFQAFSGSGIASQDWRRK